VVLSSAGFGMAESAPFERSRFCPGADILSQRFERLQNVIDNRPFTFVINGETIASDVIEAVKLSPFVGEQLQCDRLSTLFSISDASVSGSTFQKLRQLLDGSSIAISRGLCRPLISLSRFLGNRELEKLFLGLSFAESVSDPQLSSLSSDEFLISLRSVISRQLSFSSNRFYSYSIADLSRLDSAALEDLLLSDDLCIQSEDWLLGVILQLVDIDLTYSGLFCHINFEMLSSEGISLFVDRFCYSYFTEDVWRKVSIRLKGICEKGQNDSRYFAERGPFQKLNSTIVSEFPAVLAGFANKNFTLLYRGSADGFHASSFHAKCDGHGNTLTIIRTKKGNIFGGYSPCVWDSNGAKRDESGTSFIFTLRNPHLRDPMIFRLRADQRHEAIYGASDYSATFGWNGGNPDILVYDSCHNRCNYSGSFGTRYENDTGLSGGTLLDGGHFVVDEIEVFEIAS
jgi:hypothetical protein